MTGALLDRLANWSLFVFGGASIALTSVGIPFWGAFFGLLSEPGFFWAAWKSRSWALFALTAWWTGWWAYMLWRNF